MVRLASIYLPNGNPPATDKYPYKLAFMERLIRHARKLLEYEEPLVLAGDFNVIPEPKDAAHPEMWTGDALFLPQTREKFRELMALGFTDALRATTDAGGLYTFWDYQAGAWQRNNGIRIDHLLLSPQATDRLQSVDNRQGDAGTRQGVRPHADPDRAGGVSRSEGQRLAAHGARDALPPGDARRGGVSPPMERETRSLQGTHGAAASRRPILRQAQDEGARRAPSLAPALRQPSRRACLPPLISSLGGSPC